MALAADQAGGALQVGPRYSPLQALDAGSSWAVPVELPQAPGYDALLPAEAGATWLGSKAFQPLLAGAAGAQFAHPGSAPQVYQPLAAASAGASWLGAQPYAALQPGRADAQWQQQQTPTEPTDHTAAGFQATKFGTPDVPLRALPIMVGASFGTPRATFHTEIGGGSEPITAQARGWRSGSFGRPAALASLQAQAQGWQSAQFGQPVARQTLHAAAIAPATAFGTPAAQLQLQAQARGWQAARFGTPLVQRQGNAQGFAATKFGTPTAGATFGAQAQGFQASTWGAPAMAVRVHALPIAPGTRFGRPTRTWSTEC